ncbi:MAG: carbamoyl-phosphate synthase large subunit [Clostridia bacterium]|nr:carbamoyl-phosphate synthase large subunit [Clostridia bacterium]
MPKRTDIKKILIIGSGPIVVGQAAEFDWAGTQASAALREAGYEVVVVNSNPATVMTDTTAADKVYMEPLTLEYVARVLRRERPDAIIPGLGGRTGLSLALSLQRKGILRECRTELLGIDADSIEKTTDRQKLEKFCASVGEPVPPSAVVGTAEEGALTANKLGFPVMLRPACPRGETDAIFAGNEAELDTVMQDVLTGSPVGRMLMEKSVMGWKEIELEVIRDDSDSAVCVCCMEAIDPVGVNAGDSMIVAPCRSLSETNLSMLRESAVKLIRALKISGVCSVRFALSPETSEYYVLGMKPRISRSSALASKATGYPVAKVMAKIAAGLTLDEVMFGDRSAHFDPVLDHIVVRMPRFPFDKFPEASNRLGTQMKATGEAMAIGSTLPEALLKAVRSLDSGACHLYLPKFDDMGKAELLDYVREGTDDRIHAIAQLFRLGADTGDVASATLIAPVFLEAVRETVAAEADAANSPFSVSALEAAKKAGFSDKYIAKLWDATELGVRDFRTKNGIIPEYLMIDTCAKDDWSYIPCFYSSYNGAGRHGVSGRKKIIVLGSGPTRIGQGAESDYSAFHAVQAIKKLGYEAVIINNNPASVSTDYATGDKLYFEPLTFESVMDIVERERPTGVIATLGGQTVIKLAAELEAQGTRLIGAGTTAIDLSENRDSFSKLLLTLGIPMPEGRTVTSSEDGVKAAAEVGYPVLARLSATGGRSVRIVCDEAALRAFLRSGEIGEYLPAFIDKYIEGREIEADAVCDGADVFIPGIIEHVERTGIHSGDSICIYPTCSVSDRAKGKILQYTRELSLAIGVVGLINVQFIVDKNDGVFVIEASPRASRTVPFLSKATGWPIADIAALAMLGKSLREQGIFTLYPEEKKKYYVKAPAFSLSKLPGTDACLSPEMKSTGETMGCDGQLTRALYKALQASGLHVQNYGTVFATIADADKDEALPLIRRFYDLGFNIEATSGTAAFLKKNGIRTHVCAKLSEGSGEILDSIRGGHVTYVINTRDLDSTVGETDGMRIRRCATENNVAIFTSPDTVRVLLDVLEEMTICVETIDK